MTVKIAPNSHGNPYFFLFAKKRKKVLSLIILEIQHIPKARFYVIVSPRVLKIEHFFFLQSIDNQKIIGVTIHT